MSTPPRKIHNVAIILYPGTDILDFGNPLEILSNTTYNLDRTRPEPAFSTTLIARTPTIATGTNGCLTVSTDTTFEAATARISDFDILVVPGGNRPLLEEFARTGCPEIEFVKAFNALPPKEGADERIMFTVCTGALLAAAAGALRGMRATTHHMALEVLRGIDGTIEVVSSFGEEEVGRYVDGGRNGSGVRVVTAGGITCGLDAALFVAELKAGREAAAFEAVMIEHEWKRV